MKGRKFKFTAKSILVQPNVFVVNARAFIVQIPPWARYKLLCLVCFYST